ncbi:MAG: DUF433 domain-containing protein [Armatimonadota bacterium]
MELRLAVEKNPQVMSGELCFRGTRVPVQLLFNYLDDDNLDGFRSGFPSVSEEMIKAVLGASAPAISK